MPTVAVVGTGFIGPVHVEALRRIGVTVRGILGSSAEKSQQNAQALGLEVGYADYQAIIDDPQVDTVHITSPNSFHLDQAKRALIAGKHVICEKPLALNAQETAEMVKVANDHPHLVSAVHYNLRFYPNILQAREIVRSGEIGDVYHVRGGYIQDWLMFETDWNWRLIPETSGQTRAISDIGTHWIDMIGFITGMKVKSLIADLATFLPTRRKPKQAVAAFKGKETSGPSEYENVAIHTEDYGAVLFHYDNGAHGTMNVSQITAGRKNSTTFEIAGSKGALYWDGENPNELWRGHRDRPNEILVKDPSLLRGDALTYTSYPGGHAEGYPDTFKQLYRAVYGYMQAGDFSKTKPYPTFEDGHYEVMLCDAILESHQQRKWVDIK